MVLYSRLAWTISGIQIKKQNKMLAVKNATRCAACSSIILYRPKFDLYNISFVSISVFLLICLRNIFSFAKNSLFQLFKYRNFYFFFSFLFIFVWIVRFAVVFVSVGIFARGKISVVTRDYTHTLSNWAQMRISNSNVLKLCWSKVDRSN